MEVKTMTENTFFTIFEKLEDPRDNRGKRYKLINVIVLALYGTLIGYEDFTSMSYYLKKKEKEICQELRLDGGVPSHDTFSAVFRAIDVQKFMKLFVQWVQNIAEIKGKHIAIDGKAVRAATKKAEKGNIPYVLNAFMCGAGISIGQKAVGAKTNEITEIPKLLDLLDITDCVVTIDAIGTQETIMNKIVSKKGHFCLQLKSNQRLAFDDVALYFDSLSPKEQDVLNTYTSAYTKNHGRIEQRKYTVLTEESLIARILPDKKWKHVKTIGMAELTRKIKGETTKEKHFHVLDIVVDAKKYGTYAREHWEIENKLHWVLDIHFNEDRCTANSDNAISNLALLRKIAFDITKLDPQMSKKTTKKRMIDFMTDLNLFKHFIYDVLPMSDMSEK